MTADSSDSSWTSRLRNRPLQPATTSRFLDPLRFPHLYQYLEANGGNSLFLLETDQAYIPRSPDSESVTDSLPSTPRSTDLFGYVVKTPSPEPTSENERPTQSPRPERHPNPNRPGQLEQMESRAAGSPRYQPLRRSLIRKRERSDPGSRGDRQGVRNQKPRMDGEVAPGSSSNQEPRQPQCQEHHRSTPTNDYKSDSDSAGEPISAPWHGPLPHAKPRDA